MHINNNYYQYNTNLIQKPAKKTADNVTSAENIESPEIKTDYSQIPFCAIYNIKHKKIDLLTKKNNLLHQINTLLSTQCEDIEIFDRIFGMVDNMIKAMQRRREKMQKLVEEIEELMKDSTLSNKQKYDRARALKKEFNILEKQKTSKPKEQPKQKEDERVDYVLLNKFKTALQEGNFNLQKVWLEHYDALKDIKSIEELHKLFPKIRTPKCPEDVISSKIVSTLTRDFYIEFDKLSESNNQQALVALIEKKIYEVADNVAKKYPIDREMFARKIVTSFTNSVFDSYQKLKEKGSILSVPTNYKAKNNLISDIDIKLLTTDFDDFVLSSIKKHYLEGKKINEIVYTDGDKEIKLSSLRDTEYKFGKIPEKVKTINKDGNNLLQYQRYYEGYDVEEFQTRLESFFTTEIGQNEQVLNHIINFGTCKFTDEDINVLIKFLRELDDAYDGKITTEELLSNILEKDLRPRGTDKLNELEIQKAEQLAKQKQKMALKLSTAQKEFNDAINILYANNLNNIALTCSKYEPKNINEQEINNAKDLVKIIQQYTSSDSKSVDKYKLETSLRRWDKYMTYQKSSLQNEVFKKALQYATNADGSIDIDKAGKYLINSEIVDSYPECCEVINNAEIISQIITKDKAHAIEYLCKYDDYKDLAPEQQKSILKITEIFDPKKDTDKTILKHIIENDYINSDTSSFIKINENDKPIKTTIAAKAKQAIYNKYKYPQCLEYFNLFENALSTFAGDKGCAGIKNTGRNNKAAKYRMELKIMGKDDRLLSSKNDYYFDIFSDKGMH
ncbi:MAG: hypothetical protein ACI37Q_08345 [Candidatus Gastranaerophilaceae bacterium]